MNKSRTLIIGLDGYEASYAERLIAEGGLPALARLKDRSANFYLDHGDAKRTGLAWEHFATGVEPSTGARWSAVDFDPKTYGISQQPTRLLPFPALMSAKTVVFDAPYFDLQVSANLEGMVSWGAHDPGVPEMSRPESLKGEIEARFGKYPAGQWTYGFTWPSPGKTEQMGHDLVRAIDMRRDVSVWLFGERIKDWQLGIVVLSELHSAAEALWHGVDQDHPLYKHPSAVHAAKAVREAYEATDRFVAALMELDPEANVVVFNLHGMGTNDSDIGSMAALAELLYRVNFEKPLLPPQTWPTNNRGAPLFEAEHWDSVIKASISRQLKREQRGRILPLRLFSSQKKARNQPAETVSKPDGELSLNWMPATQYQRFWSQMDAFALPSFYDGRIRVNLRDREASGRVSVEDYDRFCDHLETIIRECTDPRTGQPAISDVIRYRGDPTKLEPSDADIVVIWNGPLGLDHPRYGRIGPLPYRRTGGHTGTVGAAYIAGRSIQCGHYGLTSSFDVVPTIVEMLGAAPIKGLSGKSLLSRVKTRSVDAEQSNGSEVRLCS